VMGASVEYQSLPDAINAARKVIDSITPTPVLPTEMDRARNDVISELVAMSTKPDAFGDTFLDLDTYRLTLIEDPIALLKNFTPADLQRLATRVFKAAPIATVVTGDAAQLKSALQGRTEYEILGEVTPPVKPANPSVKP
jgi:predicted Zn-dependent peptidase